MQKSFYVKNACESDYPLLKSLWLTSFDDSDKALENFFNKTVSPKRVLCAVDGCSIIGALYMLESELLLKDTSHFAYYIYAVCTHPSYRGQGVMHALFNRLKETAREEGIKYLFLVPEEKYLFGVYKKQGFSTSIFYSEQIVKSSDYLCGEDEVCDTLTYPLYREYAQKTASVSPCAVLKESTFNSFFTPTSGEVKVIYLKGKGYAVTDGKVIFELSGDRHALLKSAFCHTGAETLVLRMPAGEKNSIPYGMIYCVDGETVDNCFFGIPYNV